MSNSRSDAHIAMRKLWEMVDGRLREADVVERKMGGIMVRGVETDRGAKIQSFVGHLTVGGEFEKPDGTEELIEVVFPEDIRDLSEAEVRIDWSNNRVMGTNTPPLKDFPKIAQELIALI